jgi:precorrin-2 dehydrogenase/sirohydrochlorin ferrochelatase
MSIPRPFRNFELPIFLNTDDLLAVVVGGGRVGRRKAQNLLAAGARVRVVDPMTSPADILHDRLEWRCEPYADGHLEGSRLVFTAATPGVNEQVHADARKRGLFVCRADSAYEGDFATPATLVRGSRFRIAVSSGGASPTLARRIRDRLAQMFDEAFGQWVEWLEYEREEAALALWKTQEGEAEFLAQISDLSWFERFRTEGEEAILDAYAELAQRLGLCGHIK